MRASEVLGLDYGTALNRSLNSLVPDGYERMHKPDYLCENAIGITDSVTKAGNYTFINLGDGNDFVDGFLNSGNIFLLGNGSKKINGGKDDIFIFNGNSTTGYINGGSGTDTADLGNFALDKSSIAVNLGAEFIDHSLKIVNINKILARKGKRDEVNCACNTGYVDGRGGKSSEEKDVITIPQLNCAYKLQLVIRSNTIVYNQALRGNFTYAVPSQEGKAFVSLPISSQSQHRFTFNYTLTDISSIDVKSNNTITFNFVPTLQNGNFNITVLYDRQNTTSYLLSDNTEIKVNDKNNLYALQKSDKAINEIINDYSAIANRLKMSIFVQSILNNETAAIGHGKHDVLHNNPYYKSHLVGNGRENIFVITSGYETLGENKLPAPEVIIYDVDTENKIDTLDLRQIKQQIKRDLSREVEARIIVSNQDLLITLFCLNPVKIITTVRLKDALVSDWYDRLNVILDNVHMKIEKGIWLNSFDLKPIPLVFGEEKEIVVIKPEDIEKENKLVILRKAGDYVFARSENDLIITNAFDYNLTDNEFCTISFSKFYQEAKMQTLVIKFAERDVVLKDEMEKINNAATLEEQRDQHRNATYSAVFDDYVSSTQRKRRKVKGYEDQEFFYAQNDSSFIIKNDRATSGASKISSLYNDCIVWVKSSVGRWPSKPDSSNQRDQVFFYAQNNAKFTIKNNQAIRGYDNKDDQALFYGQNNANSRLKGQQVTSGGNKLSSWINTAFGFATKGISQLGNFFSSTKASFPTISAEHPTLSSKQDSTRNNNATTITPHIDLDSIILLLDVLIRKITGQKFVSSAEQSISELEATGYALNITEEFGKAIGSTAEEQVNLPEMQSKIFKAVMSGNGSKVPNILCSYATSIIGPEKAKDLFSTIPRNTITSTSSNRLSSRHDSSRLPLEMTHKISNKPRTYLSNTTIDTLNIKLVGKSPC